MIVGQKVICVNDRFNASVAAMGYVQLPTKGTTYTIRAVSLGRTRPQGSSNDADATIRVLLQELKNPIDRRHKHRDELGFDAIRFRPLETTSEACELDDRQPQHAED